MRAFELLFYWCCFMMRRFANPANYLLPRPLKKFNIKRSQTVPVITGDPKLPRKELHETHESIFSDATSFVRRSLSIKRLRSNILARLTDLLRHVSTDPSNKCHLIAYNYFISCPLEYNSLICRHWKLYNSLFSVSLMPKFFSEINHLSYRFFLSVRVFVFNTYQMSEWIESNCFWIISVNGGVNIFGFSRCIDLMELFVAYHFEYI